MYSIAFKKKMIARMLGPKGLSATELGREVDVPQSTLSAWLRKADRITRMPDDSHRDDDPSAPTPPPTDRSPEDKLHLLIAAAGLDDDAVGALLRREGLYQTQLDAWRADVLAALTGPRAAQAELLQERRRSQQLEREIARKDKALAEAAALLVLQKKFRILLGDEDASTPPRSAR
jgi:hypothetical protein